MSYRDVIRKLREQEREEQRQERKKLPPRRPAPASVKVRLDQIRDRIKKESQR